MTARGDVEAIICEQCNDEGPKRDIGPDCTTEAANKGIDLQQLRRCVQHDEGDDDDAERLGVCNSSCSPGQRGHAELHEEPYLALLRQYRHAEVWVAPHIPAEVIGKDADRLATLDHGADDPAARRHAPGLWLESLALEIARLPRVVLLRNRRRARKGRAGSMPAARWHSRHARLSQLDGQVRLQREKLTVWVDVSRSITSPGLLNKSCARRGASTSSARALVAAIRTRPERPCVAVACPTRICHRHGASLLRDGRVIASRWRRSPCADCVGRRLPSTASSSFIPSEVSRRDRRRPTVVSSSLRALLAAA